MTKVKFEPVPLSFRGRNWIKVSDCIGRRFIQKYEKLNSIELNISKKYIKSEFRSHS